jgi:hypothetical protein
MNNSTKKKKNSNNDKNNKTMPPPPSRTPQAQSFLRKYDKFTAVMVVMACGMYGAEYYVSNYGKNTLENAEEQRREKD